MNEKVMSQLDAELALAGEATVQSPGLKLLEQHRITTDRELKPMEFLFRLFGMPCFPRGELVAVTGKAKSGKTFVSSMLMACCAVQRVLAFEHVNPLRVLWYDTEQSDESTQDILKNRVVPMIDGGLLEAGGAEEESVVSKTFDVFNVRGVPWKERRSLLLEGVQRYKPDLVIVDGIRDLVNDINDGVLAQEVMEELLHLATDQHCCIVCILHENKASDDHNLRGWIGTELMNKAFEVYACEKMMPQRIFKLEQTLTRKYDISQTFYFEVDENGLPRGAAVVDTDGGADRSPVMPGLNREYVVDDGDGSWHIDVRRLFGDVMAGCVQITGGELRSQVCRCAHITSWKFYNKLLEQAIKERLIVRSHDDEGHVIYAPAPF